MNSRIVSWRKIFPTQRVPHYAALIRIPFNATNLRLQMLTRIMKRAVTLIFCKLVNSVKTFRRQNGEHLVTKTFKTFYFIVKSSCFNVAGSNPSRGQVEFSACPV